MINKQHLLGATLGAVTVAALGASALTFAQTSTSSAQTNSPAPHGVMGTVSAVNGSSITLTGKDGTTYTVDAGSASITKDMTVSVSDIKVGDTLMAHGTVSGTSVTATNIHDGVPPMGGMMGGHMGHGMGMGHGVHGTVTAIQGTTLTVNATDPRTNTTSTYTVDASSAKVMLPGTGAQPTEGSVSSIKTGDTVMVAGDVSGQSITAKMIFDGPMPQWGKKSQAATTSAQ